MYMYLHIQKHVHILYLSINCTFSERTYPIQSLAHEIGVYKHIDKSLEAVDTVN